MDYYVTEYKWVKTHGPFKTEEAADKWAERLDEPEDINTVYLVEPVE